jgi:hypothetical protein
MRHRQRATGLRHLPANRQPWSAGQNTAHCAAPAESINHREVHGVAPLSTSKDEFSYEICDNGGTFLGCPVAASFEDASFCLGRHGPRGGQGQFTETCGAAIGAHGDGERIPCMLCHLRGGREELLVDGQSRSRWLLRQLPEEARHGTLAPDQPSVDSVLRTWRELVVVLPRGAVLRDLRGSTSTVPLVALTCDCKLHHLYRTKRKCTFST